MLSSLKVLYTPPTVIHLSKAASAQEGTFPLLYYSFCTLPRKVQPQEPLKQQTSEEIMAEIPPSRVAEASNDRTTRDLLPVQVPGEGPGPTPAIAAVQRLQLVRHNTTSFLRIDVSLHLPMPRSLLAFIDRLLRPMARSLLAIIERFGSPAVLGQPLRSSLCRYDASQSQPVVHEVTISRPCK